MADDNPTSQGISKQTRRFAPRVRGGGRGAGGRDRPGRAGSSTDDQAPSPAATDASGDTATSSTSSKPIGHMRSETTQQGRLPSVHDGARTRGGTTKMRFKPTVPTQRNKKAVTTSAIDQHMKSEGDRGRGRGRGRGDRGRGRGRGRGRDVAAESTASGIFSLGPSAMSSRARQGFGAYATYGGDASSRMEPESSEGSDMINMFADGDGTVPVVFQHVPRTAGELDPTDLTSRRDKIPWLNVKSKKPSATLKKDTVKVEPTSDDEAPMDLDRDDSEPTERAVLYMDDDAPAQNIFGLNEKNEVVSVADDELLFFQLPSIVPKFEEVKEESEEIEKTEDAEMEEKVKTEKGAAAALPPAAKIPALEDAMASLELSEMPEGQIGSLVVYKSGKMKLKIGDVLLDVQQGMRSTFLEDIMVVDTESNDAKKIIELGHIVQKFVCMPDMNALLEDEE